MTALLLTDPITNTELSIDTAAAMLEQQGPVIGGAVLLFALGGWFLRRFRTAEWLTRGRRLAYASAGLMVLGAILQWRVNAAPFEGIFAALVTAWGLVMRPTVAVEPTPAA